MISVIIPIYNVEKYLSRCLDSVINQTYSDLEIILIDDGSTDSSRLICDKYAKKDPRIIVFHQTNQGPSQARNKGLDIANGEFIGFIDPDDVVSLKYFEILYKTLVNTDSDMILCNFQHFSLINEINKDICLLNSSKQYNGYNFIKDFTYQKDTVRYVVLWNKLYKRYLWNNLRFPVDVKICEDEYVWYKCMFRAKKICEIDQVLYYYFKRANSTTNKIYKQFSYKKEIAFIEALKDRIDFCKKNNLNKLLKKTEEYRNKLLRKIYITTPKDKIPEYIIVELYKNIKYIPYSKRIKIYLKKIFK
jgi:glycosyltransferase involved in cell wall biosynthesis